MRRRGRGAVEGTAEARTRAMRRIGRILASDAATDAEVSALDLSIVIHVLGLPLSIWVFLRN